MSSEQEIDLTNDSDDSGPEVDESQEEKLLETDDEDEVKPIQASPPPTTTKSPPTKKLRVDPIKRDDEKGKEQGSSKVNSIGNYTIPKLPSSSTRTSDLFGIQQRESNLQKKQGISSHDVKNEKSGDKPNQENRRVQNNNNNNATSSNSNSNSTTSANISLVKTPTQARAAPRKSMIYGGYGGSRMSISSSPGGVGAPRKIVSKQGIGRKLPNGDVILRGFKPRGQSDDKSDEENNDDDDGSESDTSTCSKQSDDGSDSTEFPEFAQTMQEIDEATRKGGSRRSQQPQVVSSIITEQQAGPEVYYLCEDDEDAYQELMEKLRNTTGVPIVADDLYCEHCDKKYQKVNQFIVHHRRHFFQDHFKCTICHRGFLNLNLCLIHEINEHGDENDRAEKLKPFIKLKRKNDLEKVLHNGSSSKNKNKVMNGHSSSSDESSDEEVTKDVCLTSVKPKIILSTSLTVYRGPPNSVTHLSKAFDAEVAHKKSGDLGQQIKHKRDLYAYE